MMLHAKRPGGPVAAVQNCATYDPLSIWHGVEDVRRGALCGGRLAVVEEGLSHYEAGRRFGIDRRTVKKMLSYSSPPGYRRSKPVRRPKLDGFTGIVDAILEADPIRRCRACSATRRIASSSDFDALRDLPTVPFEACEYVPGRVSSTALVRYRLVDYSAPAVQHGLSIQPSSVWPAPSTGRTEDRTRPQASGTRRGMASRRASISQ